MEVSESDFEGTQYKISMTWNRTRHTSKAGYIHYRNWDTEYGRAVAGIRIR